MSAMDLLHPTRGLPVLLAPSFPGMLQKALQQPTKCSCNHLHFCFATTYIFGLQLSTFLLCNKHDDDKKDMDRLRNLIKCYDEKHHIEAKFYCYENGSKLLSAIPELVPDMIFLDINMGELDGLTLAKKIRERYEDVPIVLVTAFINYALDGYKVRASRFLVKDDLDKTLPECMDDICRQIQRKTKHMLFTCVEGDVDIKLSEIIFIETTGHKSIIHLGSRDYHLYESMDDMDRRLKTFGFLRVHQSFMVGIRHIRTINNYILTLDTGYEIKIPKARYKQVRRERALYVGKQL